jgi:hypothetical protein
MTQSSIDKLIDDIRLEELTECCNFILRDKSCGTKFQREGLVRRLKEYRRPKSTKERALELLSFIEARNDFARLMSKSQLQFIRDALEES